MGETPPLMMVRGRKDMREQYREPEKSLGNQGICFKRESGREGLNNHMSDATYRYLREGGLRLHN